MSKNGFASLNGDMPTGHNSKKSKKGSKKKSKKVSNVQPKWRSIVGNEPTVQKELLYTNGKLCLYKMDRQHPDYQPSSMIIPMHSMSRCVRDDDEMSDDYDYMSDDDSWDRDYDNWSVVRPIVVDNYEYDDYTVEHEFDPKYRGKLLHI